MEQFKVVCINNKNKPAEIPQGSWLEQDETYTVVGAANMARQGNIIGFKLAEVEIPQGLPYEYYSSHRFRPYTDDDAKAEKAVEELLIHVEELELLEI